MENITITQVEARQKAFPFESLKACESAFVDMRLPKHEGKKNYSIIGAGVAQSSKQFVNCYEPHGFNIGAVSLPVGHINDLHSHFTAEVFIIQSGSWEFFWGQEGENRLTVGPLTIVSVPTWIFRGFKCLEEGFIFTALGENNTGGVIHHPKIIKQSQEQGVHLMENNMIVDRAGGEDFPSKLAPMEVLNHKEMRVMREASEKQFAERVLTLSQANFSSRALLDSCLEGHKASLAPAIGWGLTMDREQIPLIQNPHNFTVEWLRIPSHNSVSSHRIKETEVLLVLEGELSIRYNPSNASERPKILLGSRGSASIPSCSWREFRNDGEREAVAIIVCGRDGRKIIEWEPGTVESALQQNWGIDPASYIADAGTLRYVSN